MKIFIKNMVCIRCQMVVKAELGKLGVRYVDVKIGEVNTVEDIPRDKLDLQLITKSDYIHLLNLLDGITVKLDKIVKSTPTFSGEWIDTPGVCEMLHISSRTMQNYRDRGILSYSQIGNKILYKRSDIDGFLDEHYIKRSQ